MIKFPDKGIIMDDEKTIKKIAQLESLNDQLQAEFNNLDAILKKLGFEQGIITLKQAAQEMLQNKKEDNNKNDTSEE